MRVTASRLGLRSSPSSSARVGVARLVALALLGTSAFVVAPARAQTFPADATWTPLRRGGAIIGDAIEGANHLDLVGDAANPALYIHSDAADLFFRIRVNQQPITGGNFDPISWGCMVDSNGVLTNAEFLAIVNGAGTNDAVRWRWNQTAGGNTMGDDAEVDVGGDFGAGTHARLQTAPSMFSGNADFFIDFAIPWATIRAGGNGAPAVPAGRPLRFACGSSSSGTATSLPTDAASPDGNPASLSNTWSQPYVCGNTGCNLDSDGDGVSDATEVLLGSLPNDADSDDDGIPDNVELTPPGGGAFAAVDTDGDGTIDARDTDSDNDCVRDSVEGVGGYRNAAAPEAVPSANCGIATPVCLATTGTCVVCDGHKGGGTAAACVFDDAPACQVGGALGGRCTQCSATNTSVCPTEAPACTAAGSCIACNGDRGAAVTAPCPSASAPACQTTGALFGQCTQCSATNTAACQNPTPACNVGSGICAPCNGDRGGGATRACPAEDAPTCAFAGAGAGTCAKCTSNADCGSGHTGPTCDTKTGACVDRDSDSDGLNDSVELLLGTDPYNADSDGDGIGDATEVTPPGGGATTKVDTDGDGTIDARDTDSDNDGVSDREDGSSDLDGDGKPNYRDDDDDGDGIPTAVERSDARAAKVSDDVDQDGKPNYFDTDSDADGKDDRVEGRGDDDNDGVPNYLDPGTRIPDAGRPTSDAGATVDSGESLEGSGLLCDATERRAGGGATLSLGVIVAGAIAGLLRRRRR